MALMGCCLKQEEKMTKIRFNKEYRVRVNGEDTVYKEGSVHEFKNKDSVKRWLKRGCQIVSGESSKPENGKPVQNQAPDSGAKDGPEDQEPKDGSGEQEDESPVETKKDSPKKKDSKK